MKVISGLYPGVTTVELDNLAAEICATNATKHPDFATLAARIAVSNLHKETKKVFSGELSPMFIWHRWPSTSPHCSISDTVDVMTDLYNWINPKTDKHSPMISKTTYDLMMAHSAVSEPWLVVSWLAASLLPVWLVINFIMLYLEAQLCHHLRQRLWLQLLRF